MSSPDRHFAVSDTSVTVMRFVECMPTNNVFVSACASKRMLCTDNGELQAAEYLKWPWTSAFSIPMAAGTVSMSVCLSMCVWEEEQWGFASSLHIIALPNFCHAQNISKISMVNNAGKILWPLSLWRSSFRFYKSGNFKHFRTTSTFWDRFITLSHQRKLSTSTCVQRCSPARGDRVCSHCIQQRKTLVPYRVPYCAHRLRASMNVADLDMA